MPFLVFQLYGDMASWGDIAVGEQRPILPTPTKSAIIGLIAGSMGIDRENDADHIALNNSLKIGIQVIKRGGYLTDYHTVQTATQASLNKKKAYTRKEELASGDLNTILSSRDYWISPYYRIAIQCQDNELLSKILLSLKEPIFTPFLGRKSCPFSFPLAPQLIECDYFEDAINLGGFKLLSHMDFDLTNTEFWWEPNCQSNLKKSETVTLRTSLESRVRWQFSELQMHVSRNQEG